MMDLENWIQENIMSPYRVTKEVREEMKEMYKQIRNEIKEATTE